MTNLTSNEQSFIVYMQRSNDHLRKGVTLLLERDDFDRFFDGLTDAGLFNPENNPVPVPTDDGQYYRIPYWATLDYVSACARRSGEQGDMGLAEKVMNVVREVSHADEATGGELDNYHTHRVFAEILGLVPPATITLDYIELIPGWLVGRFDRGGVCHTLDQGAMERFLVSDAVDDWHKALRIMTHCIAIRWQEEEGYTGSVRRKPVSIVDDYWLKRLIDHHTSDLGSKLGRETADVFLHWVRDVYGNSERQLASYLIRPAIEEHEQNYDWSGVDNRCIEALRDSLIAWVDNGDEGAALYVKGLLRDELDVVRRIGIYLLNIRWQVLGDLYPDIVGLALFDQAQLHELYGLLEAQFASFDDSEKAATLNAIKGIPHPENADDPDLLVRLMQMRWLSAIESKGFEAADTMYQQLARPGKPPKYPDFLSYHESSWGPSPTPYSPHELLAIAPGGKLVKVLNAFEPDSSWEGPTKRALVDALGEAVGLNPQAFLGELPEFLSAQRCYQYGVINGFKALWDRTGKEAVSVGFDWDRAWPKLIRFFGQLFDDDEFWNEPAPEDRDMTPTRDWIPGLVAGFLRAGTRDDDKAYAAHLLPAALTITDLLLTRTKAVEAPDDDPMTQAINSQKGKAVEALFSHALRAARVADKTSGDHSEAWAQIEPIVSRELGQCRGANFEFSTLAGSYLVNLQYLSSDWVADHVQQVFPNNYSDNCACALGGLAYAQATRPAFILLRDSGVIDRALRMQLPGRHTRERLVERVGWAYLWGDEPLNSSRFNFIFDKGPEEEDLETLSTFFWSVSNQDVSLEQVESILAFWRRCVDWSAGQQPVPTTLLAHLSRLTCYFDKIRTEDLLLLLATVPHVNESNHAWELTKSLERLAPVSPREVSQVVAMLLKTYRPSYDYEDRWKALIRKLAEHDHRLDALKFAEQLSGMGGMDALYQELRSSGGD